MGSLRLLAAALLCAVSCLSENPVAGKWSCTDTPDTGTRTEWTLVIQDDGSKLTGFLTDGDAKIPLSNITINGEAVRWGFSVNDKPYTFEGKAGKEKLEGRFSGEEANGTLNCIRAAEPKTGVH